MDTISLKITQQTLSKGDLAVLNMLKNNDWSRPIYFCTSVGSDFYPTKSIDEYADNAGKVPEAVAKANAKDRKIGRASCRERV